MISTGRCCRCNRTRGECSRTELLGRFRIGGGVDAVAVAAEAVVPAHESFLQIGQGYVARCPVLIVVLEVVIDVQFLDRRDSEKEDRLNGSKVRQSQTSCGKNRSDTAKSLEEKKSVDTGKQFF